MYLQRTARAIATLGLGVALAACTTADVKPDAKPTLGDKVAAVTGSKEVFAACEVADILTTWKALALGATEMSAFPFGLLVLLHAGVVWVRYHYDDQIDKGGGTVVNILACLPLINNIQVIKQQKAINAAGQK
jgi:hypothetical protein